MYLECRSAWRGARVVCVEAVILQGQYPRFNCVAVERGLQAPLSRAEVRALHGNRSELWFRVSPPSVSAPPESARSRVVRCAQTRAPTVQACDSCNARRHERSRLTARVFTESRSRIAWTCDVYRGFVLRDLHNQRRPHAGALDGDAHFDISPVHSSNMPCAMH